MRLSCLPHADSFFLSAEVTMKKIVRNGILLALSVVVILGFAYLTAPQNPKTASIAKDIQKDHSRFTPSESVDIAMAMKLVTHEPPSMLNPPADTPTLLLYPPSNDELARMTGE